jgi:transposase, IS30 family
MYKHVSLEEREQIAIMQAKGLSHQQIAQALGRKQSTVSRELKRNRRHGTESLGKQYIPCRAQALADKRAVKQRAKAPLKGPHIFLYVREHLREPYGWTPEQIAGRLPLDHPGSSISPETIYQYIYGKGKRYKLWQLLPLARKKRMKKQGRRVRRDGKIPGVISIDLRPKAINDRIGVGHWETDNIIGKATDTTAISTTVERVTRLTVISKLADRSAPTKAHAVMGRLNIFPALLRQSLTIDNGKENASLPKMTAMPVYACHAYHSWEKGTNENTNGRMRRYIPKGVSLDTITDEHIALLEYRLNTTPRKCLGFLTPYEKMKQLLKLQ